MARRKNLQTNFSAGELSPDLAMRQETEQYRNGARSLRNMRCLIGGGVTRRPGMTWLIENLFDSIAVEFIVNQDTVYILCFGAGEMTAFLPDGTSAGSLSSCPWTGDIWEEMDYFQTGNTIFLAHASMETQVVTRTGASSWERSAFPFYTGTGGRTEQPYYKVVDEAVTLAPSALTGSINLLVSDAVFTQNHVGTIIRYLGREILIATVLDTLNATGTVVETLPPTQTLTVTSSAHFATGHVVLGDTSGARGEVTGIPDGTHLTVVIISGLTPFEAEDIIGPDGFTAISAVANATPAAVRDFDQQLFSAQHGYPARVGLHRNRILFAGHPEIPNALIASKLGNLLSFDVGTGGDTDAIFELIGDASAAVIVQLVSAEQLLIATDAGLYYVPETLANPFRPSSIAFLKFGQPWPITATAKARAFDNGVMFTSGSLLIMARPTGNLSASWEAEEVSLQSSHLINTPVRLGAVTNYNGGPERYAVPINADGTAAAVQIVAAQRIRNATPWDTTGTITSIIGIQGALYATTVRTIDTHERYFLEVFDQDVTLDLAREMDDLDDPDAGVVFFYGGETVNVVQDDYSLGTYPLTIEEESIPDGPFIVGLDYETLIETLPPAMEGNDGPIAGDMARHCNVKVFVKGSALFRLGNYTHPSYRAGSDELGDAPPTLSGMLNFGSQAWEVDPTLSITQPHPLRLTVLAVKSEVVS